MEAGKTRNHTVDVIRGIAMLMVVLGHTMTGTVADAENRVIYNMIWSLQMPLFMLISGYVMRYSRGATDAKGLGLLLLRRVRTYFLPWAVWTFLVRGLIFGQHRFFDIPWLVNHMDSGYWFLFSLLVISVIFALADFFAGKIIKKREGWRLVLTTVFYGVGAAALLLVGLKVGLSFLCIKLTVYYMPFFFAGYLFGKLRQMGIVARLGRITLDVVVVLCAGLWFYLVIRYNMFRLSDGGMDILLRAGASLAGCVAVCGAIAGAISGLSATSRAVRGFAFVGVHSLEIYLIHYLVLCPFKVVPTLALGSVKGALMVAVNFAITVLVSLLLIKLAEPNRVLQFSLFGRLQGRKNGGSRI